MTDKIINITLNTQITNNYNDDIIVSYNKAHGYGFFMNNYIESKCKLLGGEFYTCGNSYTCTGFCTKECAPPICVFLSSHT